MKKAILLLLAISFISSGLFAQSLPLGMKYQAVARDATGEVLSNKEISLKISLLSNAPDGNVLYQETHQVKANQLGLFDLVIGQGNAQYEIFNQVPWSQSQVWMEVAVDENGGNNFITVGSSQLLAVPYAFHAATADEVNGMAGENKQTAFDNAEIGLRSNGSKGNTWKVGGNILNVPGPHNLGTIEDVDLVFITNNIERLVISSTGQVGITSDVESTDIDNGAFVVAGGVGIGKRLNVGGDLSVKSTKGSGSPTAGALRVAGGAGIGENLNVYGNTNVESTASSTTTSSGALTVSGGAGIGENLNVGGLTNLNGITTVSTSLMGPEDQLSSYPLIVEGGQHGIGISVKGTLGSDLHRSTNFLTLFDEEGTALGRIEGFQAKLDNANAKQAFDDVGSLFAKPDTSDNAGKKPFPTKKAIQEDAEGRAAALQDDVNQLPGVLQGVVGAFNSDYGVGIVSGSMDVSNSILSTIADIPGCFFLGAGCDDPAVGVLGIAHSILQLTLHIGYFSINPGVAFESGGADYAEWLEKFNEEETFQYGDVVGVVGVKISKEFSDADKFMVVSLNPTVIGAMPDAENDELYEMIAFMGQVPVKVIGEVMEGDYIFPSGNADGLAVAVKPNKMKARDYQRIIGIAWGELDGEKIYDYVNVAVGINANDMANMIEQMQGVLNKLQLAMEQVNPDYDPYFYAVDGNMEMANIYSVAPSVNEVINSKFYVDNLNPENVTEKFQQVKQDMIAQGVDLRAFPYLSDILDNPNDQELLDNAYQHYTSVIERLQAIYDANQGG